MNKMQFKKLILNEYKKSYDQNNDGPHCLDFQFKLDDNYYKVEWWHRAPAEYKQEFLMLQKMYPNEYYTYPECAEYTAHIFECNADFIGGEHVDTLEADSFNDLFDSFYNSYAYDMIVID